MRRKLVLFSDSRQDAAKLAVGVAKSHWLDGLRQALVDGMADSTRAVLLFERQVQGTALSPEETALAGRFAVSRQTEAQAIHSAQHPTLRTLPSAVGGLTMEQLAAQVLARARAGLSRVTDLEEEAARRLLTTGMNPGGVDRSVMWTDLDEHQGEWQRLFDWTRSPPDYRPALSGEEQAHRTRVQVAAREAVAETLFSGGRRDLESLKLGYVTFDRMSERLANRDILPMFGFPTRARLLYHKQPANWPPRQIVDRDLELAVSMFAPGAETVKERTIHTAIGVAHYRPQGPRAVEDSNPLGPSVRIGLCGNCQHVETVTPDVPACPVCASPAGPDERDYHPMDLRQPKGFVSYFTKARDYDGVFDFVPRAARPKVGRPAFPITPHLNFDVGAGQGRLHVVNDNAGRLFHFSQERWAGTEAMIDIAAANAAEEKHAASVGRRPGRPLAPTAPVVPCALAAISETDMMLLGIRDYGPGRGADPALLEGQFDQRCERRRPVRLRTAVRMAGYLTAAGIMSLPMCRRDIADYLGLTIETISRIMSRLEELGVLGFLGKNQRQIVLLDREKLASLQHVSPRESRGG